MKKENYFIDSPATVIAIIIGWWSFWIIIANIRTKYLAPDMVTIGVVLYIVGMILSLLILQSMIGRTSFPKNIVAVKEVKYPFFYPLLIFGICFLVFICVPKMAENFFNYRISIYFDDSKGIKSIIYPNPLCQLLFDIIFFDLPLCFIMIGTFIGNKPLFRQAAIMLCLYSIVTLSRGVYLTILLFYLIQPHVKYKLLKFSILVTAMILIIPDYIEYNTLGFSLLEKFGNDNNLFNPLTYRSDRYSSLGMFFWPINSFIRVFIPGYFTGFEALTINNSTFVDIGRTEEVLYNAFYTNLLSPIYDLGLLGPFVLGLFTTAGIVLCSLFKNKFASRVLIGYIFYISMSGNTMNFLLDRTGIPLIIVMIILSRHYKFTKQADFLVS